MKTLILTAVVAAASLYASGADEHGACSNATLQGDYGFSISGSRPSGPGGPIEQILGVAMTHFDGVGTLTQTDNIHGSISASPSRIGRAAAPTQSIAIAQER